MYEDFNDALRLEYPEDENEDVGNVLMFLLSTAGGMHVSREAVQFKRIAGGWPNLQIHECH